MREHDGTEGIRVTEPELELIGEMIERNDDTCASQSVAIPCRRVSRPVGRLLLMRK